ncbi:MAG: hypothetical protein ACE5D8_06335 [Fidelibacterota bacterium]
MTPPPSVGGNQLSTTANTGSFQPLTISGQTILPGEQNFFLSVTYNQVRVHTKKINFISVNRRDFREILSLSMTMRPHPAAELTLAVPWTRGADNRWKAGEVAILLRSMIPAWKRGNFHLTNGVILPEKSRVAPETESSGLATDGRALHRIALDGWRFQETKYILGMQWLLDVPVSRSAYRFNETIMQVSIYQRDQRFVRQRIFPSLQLSFRRDYRPSVKGWYLFGSAGLDYRHDEMVFTLTLRGPLITGIPGLDMRQSNLALNLTWMPQ